MSSFARPPPLSDGQVPSTYTQTPRRRPQPLSRRGVPPRAYHNKHIQHSKPNSRLLSHRYFANSPVPAAILNRTLKKPQRPRSRRFSGYLVNPFHDASAHYADAQQKAAHPTVNSGSMRDSSNVPPGDGPRWNSKSMIPRMSSSLVRSSTQKSVHSTTTTATSSFLPELNSTPPMPTFQKPDMATPTPIRQAQKKENATPTRGYIPRRPNVESSPLAPRLGRSFAPSPSSSSSTSPPSMRRSAILRVAVLEQRIVATPTPPLPDRWTKHHDQAICDLDTQDYFLPAIADAMRKRYPELKGALTPAMIEKRLRMIDQNTKLNYFRIALGLEVNNTERSNRPNPSEALRTGSNMVLNEKGGADRRLPSSNSLTRSPPTAQLDAAAVPAPSGRNVITKDFFTGFRSHMP